MKWHSIQNWSICWRLIHALLTMRVNLSFVLFKTVRGSLTTNLWSCSFQRKRSKPSSSKKSKGTGYSTPTPLLITFRRRSSWTTRTPAFAIRLGWPLAMSIYASVVMSLWHGHIRTRCWKVGRLRKGNNARNFSLMRSWRRMKSIACSTRRYSPVFRGIRQKAEDL